MNHKPTAYFASQPGPRILTTGKGAPGTKCAESVIPNPESPTCPLCRGTLVKDDGLYRCQGHCGVRWLQDAPGHLVDLAALPFGVCSCCEERRALVKGERGAVCPVSGEAYLLLPDGTPLPADAAPHGVCQCCVPPMPLVWREGNLVCQAHPDQRYRRLGDRVVLIPASQPTATPAETLAAIDAALRNNSARVMVNGLFDVE